MTPAAAGFSCVFALGLYPRPNSYHLFFREASFAWVAEHFGLAVIAVGGERRCCGSTKALKNQINTVARGFSAILYGVLRSLKLKEGTHAP